MKKIMIDARSVDQFPFGVGNYASALISRFPTLRPDWEWYFIRYDGGRNWSEVNADGSVNIYRNMSWDSAYPFLQTGYRELLDEYLPDIFHSLWYPAAEIASMGHECVSILTVHDMISEKGYPEFQDMYWTRQRYWYMRSRRAADLIITPSHATMRDVVFYDNFPMERIKVIPEAAGLYFSANEPSAGFDRAVREKYNLPEKFIFMPSHYDVSYKNLGKVFQAADMLSRKGVKVPPLLSVGAREVSRTDSWIKLTFVSSEELASILRSAMFTVYPSKDEGFGLTPLESMSSGTPVACSRAASMPEVCGDSVLYFDPESVSELAGVLKMLLESRELRELFSAKGIARASLFSWDDMAKETLKVYENACRLKKKDAESLEDSRISWKDILEAEALPPPLNSYRNKGDYLHSALWHIQKGDSDKAFMLLLAEYKDYPECPDAARELGKMYKQKNDWENAEAAMRRLYDIAYRSGAKDHIRSACYHLGECCFMLGRHDEAEKLLEDCLRLCPDHKAAPVLLKKIKDSQRADAGGLESGAGG